jgi:hypothetical protein
LKYCKKILAIVLLMSSWKIPVFGEPQTTLPENSSGSEMRLYSELEVEALIEELSGAAEEAMERAAAEGARAAALASLEREAAAVREAARLQGENSRLKQSRVKAAIVTGIACFLGGFVTGTTVILIGR